MLAPATDRPLAIAYLVDSFPNVSETFIYRKFQYLIDHGHDVHVFCEHVHHVMPWPAQWQGRIHGVPGHDHSRRYLVRAAGDYVGGMLAGTTSRHLPRRVADAARRRGVRPRDVLPNLLRLLRRRWDLIHVHFLPAIEPYLGVGLVAGCPVIASVYGYDATINRHLPGGPERICAQVADVDALFYSSEFLRQAIADIIRGDVPEFVLHPETIPAFDRPRERRSWNAPIRLLTVGRLHWTKGYAHSLPAVRRLVDMGIDCVYRIVGEGSARDEIEYTIRALHLEDRVQLVGALPPDGVAQQMDWADLYLLPSIREDFGVVLVEAQAMGLPIVATRVGGVPEAVREGETAVLVPPHDPGALADAVRALVADPDRGPSFSRNGPAQARPFACDTAGSKLVQHYRTIIQCHQNWPAHCPPSA